MSLLRIERVLELPVVLTASTMYVVKSAESPFAEIVFTNSDGTEARHVINKAEITSLITNAVSDFTNIQMVADITARDALVLDHNGLVLVLDATGDATVLSGAAMYFYDMVGTTWYKVSEFESMDVTLTWAAIQGKPTSAVADIDDAVTKRHVHANKVQIDLIGEDANGKLTYNGVNPEAHVAVSNW